MKLIDIEEDVFLINEVVHFIHDLSWKDIPHDVRHTASRCMVDLCATLIGGRGTQLSEIVRAVAVDLFGGQEATLLLDGRRVSAPGAALVNAMTIDAMDMHDGYRLAKGHAGVNVFPAALAMGEVVGWNGEEFAAATVIGYEIALRAAVALHATSCDYHTSGAWGALGAAGLVARALALDAHQTSHALGIAEYYAPRSQMMRCIDHPTMLKDGSGWGAMTGLMASQLAAKGFTGAPAITVEGGEVDHLWQDLGQRWLMRDLYFKPYAVCRWAQPAVEGAYQVAKEYQLTPDEIERIHVETFAAATRLTITRPANTEQAQYSLPYPVAAMLVNGRLDPEQVTEPCIRDETILRLADSVTMAIDDDLEARFPEHSLARVTIHTCDGRRLASEVCAPPGDPSNPLSDEDLGHKFERLGSRCLAQGRLQDLMAACWNFAASSVEELVALLAPLPEKSKMNGW
jgi:2-methylcitrate dehydratase PrpD